MEQGGRPLQAPGGREGAPGPAPPADSPPGGWADLPRKVVETVARAVPAGDRLWFRLVCKSWAAAGAEAQQAGGEGEEPLPPGVVTRTRGSDAAASVARAEMVLGVLKKPARAKFKSDLCRYSAQSGDLSVLQWARAKGCRWNGKTCSEAAWDGHLEMLKWARAHECPWDAKTCANAALNGHLEVLQWARAQGCPWNKATCTIAAKNGHLATLQWARAQGCPWYNRTCHGAAGGRHLAVLQWARAQGCPWDEWTCTSAAENGHLAVLQWAHAQGCPWD